MDQFGSKSACHDPQLNLNARLISTRHIGSTTGSGNENDPGEGPFVASDTNGNIPFLWETTPGVPKYADGNDNREQPPLPPNLPPSWLCPRDDGGSKTTNRRNNFHKYDDGNDVDVDDGSEEDVFSDTVDMSPLSGSLGAGCTTPARPRRLEGLDINSSNWKQQLQTSPSFIINRFLPAAHALAASSAFHSNPKASKFHHPKKAPTRPSLGHQFNKAKFQLQHIAQVKNTQSQSSPRACGLVFFFPRSLMQAPCGQKIPVASQFPEDRHKTRTRRVNNCSSIQSLNSEEAERDDGFDDSRTTITAATWAGCRSPGWGLPFLEWGKWEKKKGKPADKKKVEIERRSPKKVWSLPPLKAPSESWLSEAMNSTKKNW